ncbi:MAG: sigma-54 dependent transcriptional regulator [Nitrospiraceae bacterium]|nr:sigma-54 dependent transcriptional regulator [Nitrospiraceae bacterium]
MKPRILIVDHEPYALKVLAALLRREGYDVLESISVDGAISILEGANVDTVVTDIRMPGKEGQGLFEFILKKEPDLPVIFLTAHGNADIAVDAVSNWVFHHIVKPPDYSRLKGVLARAVEQRKLKREIERLKQKLAVHSQHRISGGSAGIQKIQKIINSVRDSASNVLVNGETGTGKELVARALHFGSIRGKNPFVAVNCAAIPGPLLESELFGYEKGAFTGAGERRAGRFEEACAGTMLLDEISELGMAVQSKLLRVLQEREIERIGSNKKIKINFRLVCASSKELLKEVRDGRFREDLYYRINEVEISVPPLRERKEDLPLLAAEFLNELNAKEGKIVRIAADAMECLQRYEWPGNVRQLKNAVEWAFVLAGGGVIMAEHLPREVAGGNAMESGMEGDKNSPLMLTLKELENAAVKKALMRCDGNKSKAARLLGISRKSFYKRLESV